MSEPKNSVSKLDDYRPKSHVELRQERIRSHVTEFASQQGESAAVAIVGASIKANGEVTTTALNVEAEHVVPLVSALNKLTGELMRFLGKSR